MSGWDRRWHRVGEPRVVGVALVPLLVTQAITVAALRDGTTGPSRIRCGRPVPAADAALHLDVDLQLSGLPAGARGGGVAVLTNSSRRAIVVLTTQAVLLAPAGRDPASAPEPPPPSR